MLDYWILLPLPSNQKKKQCIVQTDNIDNICGLRINVGAFYPSSFLHLLQLYALVGDIPPNSSASL